MPARPAARLRRTGPLPFMRRPPEHPSAGSKAKREQSGCGEVRPGSADVPPVSPIPKSSPATKARACCDATMTQLSAFMVKSKAHRRRNVRNMLTSTRPPPPASRRAHGERRVRAVDGESARTDRPPPRVSRAARVRVSARIVPRRSPPRSRRDQAGFDGERDAQPRNRNRQIRVAEKLAQKMTSAMPG